MVLVVLAVVVGALSGLVGGGRPRNLVGLAPRFVPLLALWALFSVMSRSSAETEFALHLAALASLLCFAVANIPRVTGIWLVALGVGLNLFTTANNGGMPYRVRSLQTAGVLPANYSDVPKATPVSHPERPGDQLVVLGEIVPIPPLRTVVSFGDLFIAFGLMSVVANGLLGRRTGRQAVGRAYVPRHKRAEHSNGEATPGSASLLDPVLVAPIGVTTGPDADGDVASTPPNPLEDSAWKTRMTLLRLTGDSTALLDLTGGLAKDPADVAAAHVVAGVLRSHEIDAGMVRSALKETLRSTEERAPSAAATEPSPEGTTNE